MSGSFIEGRALVASPYLLDRNFHRSVVYLFHHDEQGAQGLVLTEPLGVPVRALLAQVLGKEADDLDNDEPIYQGGPVEGPIVVIHEKPTQHSLLCPPGVYLTSDQHEFATICQQKVDRYRVFNGYSGWGPQQLEEELQQGSWLVWQLSKADLFLPSDEIWKLAVRTIGQEILIETIHPTHVPTDPSLN